MGRAERDQRDRHLDDEGDERERRQLDQAGADPGRRQRRSGEAFDQEPEDRHAPKSHSERPRLVRRRD